MTMSLTRATYALRSAGSAIQRRNLAILPTVKVASDTSKMDFPAPSHVSLSSEALNIAKQVTAFYANPDSSVSLTEEARASLQAELAKRVNAIPDGTLPQEWVNANLSVPSEIRLGDNPIFGSQTVNPKLN